MTTITIRGTTAGLILAGLTLSASGGAEDVPRAPAPPLLVERPAGAPTEPVLRGLGVATEEYAQGDPSDQEQLFLELMNRARLDPAGEADLILDDYDDPNVTNAVDFFLGQRPGVEYSRKENHDAFDALAPVQPLAFNAQIMEAARKHTVVMRTVDLQVHQAVGEPPLGDRITAEGYTFSRAGESIFAFAKSMVHAHAGFAIDWGQGLEGGSGRPATGHRDSLMRAEFSECGVAVLADDDAATKVGPLLITIDFGAPLDTSTRLVTGVVYDDRNGSGFYDPGEGIPGVRIETDASRFFATTSASGGYAVPVPANAGAVTVFAGGASGTPGEVVGSQEQHVTVSGENVKVDFGPLPEPPIPDDVVVAGARGLVVADGATETDVISVGALSDDDATVGRIAVRVAIAHAAREELRLVLRSPSGTDVVLFDGAPSGTDLRGTFPDTLHTHEALSALVGEPYEGDWRLIVSDAAGGASGATVESVDLVIRPGWIRPLDGVASPLAVKTLKVKEAAAPGKDKVVVKADVNVGGTLVGAPGVGSLRLLDAASGDEILAAAIPDPDAPAAGGEGPTVKAKLDLDRKGSSHGAVVVKVSGLDLPSPLPARVRVELALGDVIVAEDVALSSGKSTGPSGARFFVDTMKSKDDGVVRTTVVKGRFATVPPLGPLSGTVELAVGDVRFTFDASELVAKGRKLVRKSPAGLAKLVVDPVKGTFSAKIKRVHEVVVNGRTEVLLRLGEDFFGALTLLPYDKGVKTVF